MGCWLWLCQNLRDISTSVHTKIAGIDVHPTKKRNVMVNSSQITISIYISHHFYPHEFHG